MTSFQGSTKMSRNFKNLLSKNPQKKSKYQRVCTLILSIIQNALLISVSQKPVSQKSNDLCQKQESKVQRKKDVLSR